MENHVHLCYYYLNFRSEIGSNPVNMRVRACMSVWLIGDYWG